MKNEEYVYRQEIKEKASVARSARYKRTHNGKSGRVRLPSDNMTNKERNAMNGEVKSYRLNEPMSWKEFKAMPDDIKITYIKLLREKFNPFDSAIADIMGINKVSFSQEIKRLGLGHGEKHGGYRGWDQKEAFYAWASGVPTVVEEETPVEEPEEIECIETVPDPVAVEEAITKRAVPTSGTMTFEGNTESILETLAVLLGGANVHISVTWDVLQE
jgi:hypothetical protein